MLILGVFKLFPFIDLKTPHPVSQTNNISSNHAMVSKSMLEQRNSFSYACQFTEIHSTASYYKLPNNIKLLQWRKTHRLFKEGASDIETSLA